MKIGKGISFAENENFLPSKDGFLSPCPGVTSFV
jgi:hypothetical protein